MAKKPKRPDPWDDYFEDLRSGLSRYKAQPKWSDAELAKLVLGLVNWQGAVAGTADHLIVTGEVEDALSLHDLQDSLAETAAYTVWLYSVVTGVVNRLSQPQGVVPGQMSIFDVGCDNHGD